MTADLDPQNVLLAKVKRPGGVHRFHLQRLPDNEYGSWLFGPKGARWATPGDGGVLPFDVLISLTPGRPFVIWWVADPGDPRIEVDVCLPPSATEEGWSYVDLELDPVRHERGHRVEIEDWDEYHDSVRTGHMSVREAEWASRTAADLAGVLKGRSDPLIESGWSRLHREIAERG